MQGIWPIGPNGVSIFDTLASSPLSNSEVAAGIISYEYTLNQQGLKSNVICSYAETNPFSFAWAGPPSDVALAVAYNASCANQGETDTLNVPHFISAWGNSSLVYWACQSGIPTASYIIYLTGSYGYENIVGNIICVINPIQSAIYTVMYRSTEDIFSATEANASSPITFSTLISTALAGLGGLISDLQNHESNIFADTIYEFGFRSFGAPEDGPSPRYLSIYEQMIQGIIEYDLPSIDLFST